MSWGGVNQISILLIVLKFKVERRIFFLRRRKLKFNPRNKPIEPYKPKEPEKTVLVKDDGSQLVYCGEMIELHGKYVIEFDRDSHAIVIPLKSVDNKFYDHELEIYHSELVKYEKLLDKYKSELKDWKAQKKIWDAQQKEKDLAKKRKLLEELKKELGET